jgi:threonine/homoserine/homoserine lactone efflux protein
MDAATLITFALALAIAAATPGPGVAAVVARALGNGFVGTLPMVAGLVVGDLLYLGFAAFGLALVAHEFGALFLLIKWLGAAYLLYLAWAMWTAPAEAPESPSAEPSRRRSFLAGLSVTFGNPKVMVFYLALLPTLVDLTHLTALGFVAIALIVVAVLCVVITAYAALAARARTLFRNPRAVRILNRGAGTVMVGAAVSIAARA